MKFDAYDEDTLRRTLHAVNYRADAGETGFIARELEHVFSETFDVEYPEHKGRRFIPIDNSVPAGAETFKYDVWDRVGMAKLIANYSDDLPRVDAYKTEETGKIYGHGAAYGWSTQDLRAIAMSGSRLNSERAISARDAHELQFESAMAIGNTLVGLTGFANNANVPDVTSGLATGTWVTSTASALQILADLNFMASSIVLITKELITPDTLVLAPEVFTIVNDTPMTTTGDSDKTVLRHFLDNNPYITSVDQWGRLSTAGAGGTTRSVCYKRDSRVLRGIESMAFTQHPPQAKNLSFVVNTESRNGAVIFPKPLGACYADDLDG